jgi:hypothetical protein
MRNRRELRLRLGGDPADDEYPDKPPRMRWATCNRQTRLSSASSPGGNVTGVTFVTAELGAKQLGLLLIEHLAGLDDHMMAVAAYWAAVAAKPSEKITLRQGARVMMRNWTE